MLNAALAGSKEAMAKLFQETTNQSVHVMKEMIFNSLVEARNLKQQTRKYSQLALLSSIAIAAILCFLLLHLLVNSLNLV